MIFDIDDSRHASKAINILVLNFILFIYAEKHTCLYFVSLDDGGLLESLTMY
jgi:hypothetical protein